MHRNAFAQRGSIDLATLSIIGGLIVVIAVPILTSIGQNTQANIAALDTVISVEMGIDPEIPVDGGGGPVEEPPPPPEPEVLPD